MSVNAISNNNVTATVASTVGVPKEVKDKEAKTTKDSQGVAVMSLKKGHRVESVSDVKEGQFAKPSRYRTKNLPAAGSLKPTGSAEQAKMDI